MKPAFAGRSHTQRPRKNGVIRFVFNPPQTAFVAARTAFKDERSTSQSREVDDVFSFRLISRARRRACLSTARPVILTRKRREESACELLGRRDKGLQRPCRVMR